MAEELGPLSGDKAVGRWVRGKRGTRQIPSCISDDTVSRDKVLFPHLVDEGVEILTKVHLQLLYPFHDQETESRGNNVTREIPNLLSHGCSCLLGQVAALWCQFRCRWLGAFASGFCLPVQVSSSSLCWFLVSWVCVSNPGPLLTRQSSHHPHTSTLLRWGHTWEDCVGKRVCFKPGFTIRASGQSFLEFWKLESFRKISVG